MGSYKIRKLLRTMKTDFQYRALLKSV